MMMMMTLALSSLVDEHRGGRSTVSGRLVAQPVKLSNCCQSLLPRTSGTGYLVMSFRLIHCLLSGDYLNVFCFNNPTSTASTDISVGFYSVVFAVAVPPRSLNGD